MVTMLGLAGWCLLAASLVGCSTLAEVDQAQTPISEPPVSVAADTHDDDPRTTFPNEIEPVEIAPVQLEALLASAALEATAMAAPSDVIRCAAAAPRKDVIDRPACAAYLQPAVEQPLIGDEMRLRPPLRRLWFHHPRLVPHGDGDELSFSDSAVLAHRTRVTSRPFRDPYGGLRDQALLHPDRSRAPARESQLPDIGPPPPKHTIKTFGTLTGLSLLGIGVYALGPSSFTGANKDEDVWGEAWGHFKNAWTKPPVFDKDGSGVNYVGHPYFGMNFYLSQRNYGESPLYSFLFSTFTSTCFEYFIESWSERPSIQDLIITPVVGSILGELVYRATQEMRKDGFTKAEKILVTIINPLYVLQNGYH